MVISPDVPTFLLFQVGWLLFVDFITNLKLDLKYFLIIIRFLMQLSFGYVFFCQFPGGS